MVAVRIVRRILPFAAAVFIGIQLVPYGWKHSNPRVVQDAPWPSAEAQVKVFTIINGDAQILADMLNELFGLGPLEALLRDPSISDILVNRADLVKRPYPAGGQPVKDLQRYLGKAMWGLLMPGGASTFNVVWPAVRNFFV